MGDYKMGSINYSIIIPHKNCPDLLQRCLNSIPVVPDIQIIIVDDNSDNDIVDFNNFPGKERINTEIYFTKEGKGAGYARNIGLERVKGKWVLFADADDYFTEDFYSIISDYKNSENDIVFFSATSIYPETGEKANRHLAIEESVHKCIAGDEDCIRYYRASPIAKMIKKSLIEDHNICFDEVKASNDTMFSLKTGYYAKGICADERVVYIITVRSGSLEYTLSRDILLCRIGIDYRVNKFFRTNNLKKKIRVIRYIEPLRFISYKLFICELCKYIVKEPFNAIDDIIFYLWKFVIRVFKKRRNISLDADNNYIKIDRL